MGYQGVPAVIWKGSNSAYCIPQNFEARVIEASAASNQIIIGPKSGNRVTLTAPAPASNRTYTFSDQPSSEVLVAAGVQTVTGTYTFNNAIVGNITGNAATATTATTAGSVTNGAYVNVANTFTLAQTITASSNQIVLYSGVNQLTLNSGTSAAARTYTIPDAGTTADFVMNAGNATIGGSKTFSSTIVGSISGNAGTVTNGAYVNVSNTFTLAQTISAASNQLILASSTNQLTLNSGTSAAARTYTVPDTGTTDTFAMLGGAQAFTALKTFNSGLAIAGGSAANNTIWTASNVLRQRGGTSGWAVDNTSGNAILSATDAGAWTLGPTTGSIGGIVHNTYSGEFRTRYYSGSTFIGETRSIANSASSITSTLSAISGASAYYGLSQSGVADRWYIGFDDGSSALNFRPSSTATAAVATISAAGAWTLGPSGGAKTKINGHLEIPRTDIATSGTITDYALGQAGSIKFTSGSAKTLDTVAGDGTDGRILYILNTSGTLTIRDNSTASGASANRFLTGSGADITITTEGAAVAVYDASSNKWRVVSIVT